MAKDGLLFLTIALPLCVPFAWPPTVEVPREFMSLTLLFAALAALCAGSLHAAYLRVIGCAAAPAIVWIFAIAVQALFGISVHGSAWVASFIFCCAMIATAFTVAMIRSAPDGREQCRHIVDTCLRAIVFSGTANAVICVLQAKNIAFETFVLYERATGALSQPNHSALLMCFAIAALCSRRLGFAWLLRVLGVGTLCYGVYLTRSRFGISMAGTLVLGACIAQLRQPQWAKTASTCAKTLRFHVFFVVFSAIVFLSTAALYVLCERIDTARFVLERDALNLLRSQPVQGVGIGQVRLAWTLAALPEKSPSVFDHAHNALLNAAVSLGIPIALLMLCACALALHRALPFFIKNAAPAVIVALAIAHSLLEQSLTYAYLAMPVFLLLCCAIAVQLPNDGSTNQRQRWVLPWVKFGLLTGSVLAGIGLAMYFNTFLIGTGGAAGQTLFPAATYPRLAFANEIERDPHAFLPALIARADAPLLVRYALALNSRKCVRTATVVTQRIRTDWPAVANTSPLFAPCRVGNREYFACKASVPNATATISPQQLAVCD